MNHTRFEMLRLRDRRSKHRLFPRVERFEDRLLLATFNVTSAADDNGATTLRAIIANVNDSSDPSNTIHFQIGAAGSAQTITLTSDLPAITKPVTIDGYSQGGTANTLSTGTNASILIQIDAAAHAAFSFNSGSAASAVKGLSIGNSSGAAIAIGSNNVTIAGDFIGLAPDGITPTPNATGISITSGVTGAIIGSTALADRNLISANTVAGINSAGTSTIHNNLIGTDKTGLVAKPNGIGLKLTGASNIVGGSAANAGNTIAFNTGAGVQVDTGTGNSITRNLIHGNGSGITLTNSGNANQASTTTLSVTSVGTLTTVQGTFNPTAAGTYLIDFYSSLAGDPPAPGQAHLFLGEISQAVAAAGLTPFSQTFNAGVPSGQVVTATVTSPSGNTSSFLATSASLTDPYIVTTTADAGIGSLRSAIDNANQLPDTNTITFAIPTSDPGYDSSTKTWKISPATAFPAVTEPVLIDGTTSLSYIGVPLIQINGASAGANVDGILLSGSASNSRIRGLSIYAFSGAGIHITSGNDTIQSNYLGLDPAESSGITGNGTGLWIEGASSNTIGGLAGSGNLISNNTNDGILISGDASTDNNVYGNTIGTGSSGLNNRGNGGNGILITRSSFGASNNVIGGLSPNLGNIIAFNTTAGITLDNSTGNAIRENPVFQNTQGIVLLHNANTGSPAPVITTVSTSAGTTVVNGTITGATSNTLYKLDFFASGPSDPVSGVQARTFVGNGTVTTDASGNGIITATLPTAVSPGLNITATATSNTSNSTSPFALGKGQNNSFIQVTTTNDQGTGSLREAIQNANASSGSTIVFALSTSDPNYNAASLSWTFNLASPLPAIDTKTAIDGTSQPGYVGSPVIVIDGSTAGAGSNGLILDPNASGSGVKGLRFQNFSGDGIQIQSSNNTLFADSITANAGNGVHVISGSDNRISQTLIFGNATNGIALAAGTNGSQAAPSGLQFTSTATGQTQINGSIVGQASGFYTVEFYVGAAGVSGTDIQAATYLGSTVVNATAGQPTAFSASFNLALQIPNTERIFATVTSPISAPAGQASNTSQFAESSAQANAFTVTTNADSGIGSLRQAILNADAQPPGTTITFAIAGSTVIRPLSPLPAITVPLIIDGTTQSGIVIDGNQLLGSGLTLAAGSTGSLIEGLTVQNFAGAGISILSDSNQLTGNHFNQSIYGVFINGGSGNIVDGGLPANSPNFSFANNTGTAIFVQAGTNNQFINNNFLNNGALGTPPIQYAINQTPPAAPVILSLTSVGGIPQATFSVSGPLNQPVTVKFYTTTAGGSGLTFVQMLVVTPTNANQTFSENLPSNVSSVLAIASSSGVGSTFGTSVFSNSANLTTNFVVTNTSDSGYGSLRQALSDSVGTSNAQIVFNISTETTPLPSEFTINLQSPLPVDHAVTINGFSEYDFLNSTSAITFSRRQMIVLDGTQIPESLGASSGEMVVSAAATIEGLIFYSAPSTLSGGISSGILDSAILITGSGAQLTSDLIGVDYGQATSQTPVVGTPGFTYGVHVTTAGSGSTIGDIGDSTISPTVIGDTQNAGIFLESANNTTIQNVFVGVGMNPSATQTTPRTLGNLGSGIHIAGGSGNTVGGPSSLSLVIVSGNKGDGVLIDQGASNNTIQNTFIGTDQTGTAAVMNQANGVHVSGATGNFIGGTALNTTDIISGNKGDGILIDQESTNNTVQNAFIGTDRNGGVAIPNQGNGVHVTDVVLPTNSSTTSNNIIGGTTKATLVLIAGNGQNGVLLDGGSISTTVRDAYIGVDPTGQTPISNTLDGIQISKSSTNHIGDIDPAFDQTGTLRNVISANGQNGIDIIDPLSTDNTVADTIIGTAVITLNSVALGNTKDGILIDGAQNTSIGLGWRGTKGNVLPSNVISGNGKNGIHLKGGAVGTKITYNFIGTDLTGLTSNSVFANSDNGVWIEGGSHGNLVGIAGFPSAPIPTPTSIDFYNIISGNKGNGVDIGDYAGIDGGSPHDNDVSGNWIGITSDGQQSVGNAAGIVINNSYGNDIGLAPSQPTDGSVLGAANVVQGNLGFGVIIQGSNSTSNSVFGNWIGSESLTSHHLGNNGGGIEILDSSSNVIGGTNHIVGNLNDGVVIEYDAQSQVGKIGNNSFLGNVISRNVGNGIRLTVDATVLNSYTSDLIQNNFIGSNDDGSTAVVSSVPLGNRLDGILVEGARVVIDHNVIVANGISGIDVTKGKNAAFGNANVSAPVIITANKIGINQAGTSSYGSDPSLAGTSYAMGNVLDGIKLDDVAGVWIGFDAGMHASGNVISGNLGRGIEINSPTLTQVALGVLLPNLVGNNFIGTNGTGDSSSDGTHILGNLSDGIFLFNPLPTTIRGNVISGNRGSGVHTQLSTPSLSNILAIDGNEIGTNQSGTSVTGGNSSPTVIDSLGNASDGIFLDRVQGPVTITNNLVSGNRSNGIDLLQSSGIVVQGNNVGTAVNGSVPLNSANFGNASNGIFLNESRNNWIGGSFAEGNTVSGNAANGIFVSGTLGSPASGNTISGNRLGVDSAGRTALPNRFSGITLNGAGATANLVGYTTAVKPLDSASHYDGNVISGNALIGIAVSNGANDNSIQGNLIGTDIDGNASPDPKHSLGNTSDGIFLNNVSNTMIGGLGPFQRNVIGGNSANGIHIFGNGSNNNDVINNFIGLNASGNAAAGNQASGVDVDNAGAGNIIGGGNRISGNGQSGILLYNTSLGGGTFVSGNSIGVDITGTKAVPNGAAGIFIFGSSGNTIGSSPAVRGLPAGSGNLISGNNQAGIEIFSPAVSAPATGNHILNNIIGLDASGSAPLGNRSDGIEIFNGSNNVIGGLGLDSRNTISGNRQNGILIDVFPTRTDVQVGNVIDGNFIGTDVSGMSAIGIQLNGIAINNSPGNIIGLVPAGTAVVPNTNVPATPRNVISGNNSAGIQFVGKTLGNTVQGNYIGVRADGIGSENLRNVFGVYVNNTGSYSSQQWIGGDTPGAGNIIGGGATPNVSDVHNTSYVGVLLSGPEDSRFTGGTQVFGNLIGLDKNGNTAGSQIGVLISNSSGNVIGGTSALARNVISGNVNIGVSVINDLSTNNRIIGNYIGTNSDGSDVPSSLVPQRDHTNRLQETGVMFTSAFNNSVGAPGAGNTISGNLTGVLVTGTNPRSPSQGNLITNNKIGTNPNGTHAVPNFETGVYISASSGNQIISNLISANGVTGVEIFGQQSSGNVVDGNTIGPGVAPDGTYQNLFVSPNVTLSPSPVFRVPGYVVYNGAQRNGISIIGSSYNMIGGSLGNTISGNIDVGLYISKRDFTDAVFASPVNNQVIGDRITQNGIYGILLYDAPNNAAGHGTVVGGNPINTLSFLSTSNSRRNGLTPQSMFLPHTTPATHHGRAVPRGPRHRRRRH